MLAFITAALIAAAMHGQAGSATCSLSNTTCTIPSMVSGNVPVQITPQVVPNGVAVSVVVDVPAVQEASKEPPNGPSCNMVPCEHKLTAWCSPTGAGYEEWPKETCQDHPPQIWTCADKSRILLYAEDGTRHCLKFNQSE